MRQPLLAVGGLALVVFAFAVSMPREAVAGPEKGWLGTIEVLDGGSLNNSTAATPFTLSANHKVSIQCPDAGAWIEVDGRPSCPKGDPCFWLPPGAIIDETVRRRTDGGVGGIIAVSCPSTSACYCNVRDNEANR